MKEGQKIRIGNDIRLAVDLRQYFFRRDKLREREVYNFDATDFKDIDENEFVNKRHEVYTCDHPCCNGCCHKKCTDIRPDGAPIGIRSVKAILINNTLKEKRIQEFKKKTRFITRFPIEPHIEAFHSTPYDVCNSGYPTWRTYPLWYGHHDHFFHYPHHHYYKGFGPNPHFDGLYRPLPMEDGSEYRANVMATERQNVVEVSFPAEHQRYTGKYTLIIVAKIFAPGFNHNNLKTITIDFPNIFELVPTTAGQDDPDILGSYTEIEDRLPSYEIHVDSDIYVKDGDLSKDDSGGDSVTLQRTDGGQVQVDLSPIVSWGDPDKEED